MPIVTYELFEIEPGTAAPEDVGIYAQARLNGAEHGEPEGPYPDVDAAFTALMRREVA